MNARDARELVKESPELKKKETLSKIYAAIHNSALNGNLDLLILDEGEHSILYSKIDDDIIFRLKKLGYEVEKKDRQRINYKSSSGVPLCDIIFGKVIIKW